MPQITIQQMSDLNTGLVALNDNVRKMTGELSQRNDANTAYFEDMSRAAKGTLLEGSRFHSITAGASGTGPTSLEVVEKVTRSMAVLGSVIPGVGPALAGLATTATAATTAYNATAGAVNSWTDSLKNSREHLRNYSGAMAGAFAMSDIRDIQRNIRESAMTAGSTRDLLESRAELRDALLPLESAMMNFTNNLMAGVNRAGAAAIDKMEGLLRMIPGMGKWIDDMRKEEKSKPTEVSAFMSHLMKDVKKRRVNRRPGYRR